MYSQDGEDGLRVNHLLTMLSHGIENSPNLHAQFIQEWILRQGLDCAFILVRSVDNQGWDAVGLVCFPITKGNC